MAIKRRWRTGTSTAPTRGPGEEPVACPCYNIDTVLFIYLYYLNKSFKMKTGVTWLDFIFWKMHTGIDLNRSFMECLLLRWISAWWSLGTHYLSKSVTNVLNVMLRADVVGGGWWVWYDRSSKQAWHVGGEERNVYCQDISQVISLQWHAVLQYWCGRNILLHALHQPHYWRRHIKSRPYTEEVFRVQDPSSDRILHSPTHLQFARRSWQSL